MRFTADLRTLTVTDTATGDVYQCKDLFETANLRRDLELASRPAPVVTERKAKRLAARAEAKQGGMK